MSAKPKGFADRKDRGPRQRTNWPRGKANLHVCGPRGVFSEAHVPGKNGLYSIFRLPRRKTLRGSCVETWRRHCEKQFVYRLNALSGKPGGRFFCSAGRETELRKAPHRALRALSLFNLPQKRRSFCRGTGSFFENARPLQFAIDLLNKSSILGTSSRKGERER